MIRASLPPTTKKNIAAAPYMMPIRLWSTVNAHERQPEAVTGRRNTPYAFAVVTTAGAAGAPTVAGTGRSIIAISDQHLDVASDREPARER